MRSSIYTFAFLSWFNRFLWFQQFQVYLKIDDYENAIKDYSIAIELNPE